MAWRANNDGGYRVWNNYARTLSDVDPALAEEVRQALAQDLTKSAETGIVFLEFTSQPRYTFMIPREARRAGSTPSRVVQDLVDRGVEEQLEGIVDGVGESFRDSSHRLYPLKTRGEGHNCLLNAASLCLWGVQDRDLLLRCAVCDTMLGSISGDKLRRRWEAELTNSNAREFGMELTRMQFESEWAEELDRIRAPDVSLGSVHVMALAQVLRRPVIVFAQPFVRGALGDAIEPDRYAGIYLPLLWNPSDCVKVPLAMAFTFKAGDVCGHFSALVGVEDDQDDRPTTLPLTREGKTLPIRYFSEDADHVWTDRDERAVLDMYLNLKDGSPHKEGLKTRGGAGKRSNLKATMNPGKSLDGRARRLMDSYGRSLRDQSMAEMFTRIAIGVSCLLLLVTAAWLGISLVPARKGVVAAGGGAGMMGPHVQKSAQRRRQGSEL